MIEDEDNAKRKDGSIHWTLFLGNPATTTKTIRNTLRIANREGLDQIFDGCHINTNIRVFDYEKPDEVTLAATYSVTSDLERIGYQQLLPSFASPPALLQDFGSEEEISLMFDHIAQTYLSTKYQETRDWQGFIRQRSTAASISRWIAELPGVKGVCIPTSLGRVAGAEVAAALQELFAERPQDGDRESGEGLAKQLVDFLVSVCLEAFPDFFETLDLPRTVDELDQMTPYELAAAVFSRWHSEKEFIDELTVLAQMVMPEWKRDFLRFCAQAMLYKFNILIRRRYRQLFIPAETMASECA